MAMRVLLRRPLFDPILSKSPSIFQISSIRIQFFSKSPIHSPQFPSDSTQESQFRHRISLSNVLQSYGFPQSHLHQFLQKNRFLSDFNPPDVEKSLSVLLSYQLPQKSIVSILHSCPRALELGFLIRWQPCFNELGLSNSNVATIQYILEQSATFEIDPDEFLRSVRALKALGLTNETLARALVENPRTVLISAAIADSWIDCFRGIGIRNHEFDPICYSFPRVLGLGFQDRFRRLLCEFEDLGFSSNEVRKMVVRDPRVVSLEAGEISRCVELLRNLKCRLPIKERILQWGRFRAGFEVKLRVDCLCRHGMIRREALSVLQREPRAIIYDLGDVEKKLDFMLQRMGYGIDSLMEVPEYLGVNFDKQILPRYSVIEYLGSVGGLWMQVGLKDLIRPSRLKFYNLFVKPYPECEKIFGGFKRTVEMKSRHRSGLWKLFKPLNRPDTEEELINIRSFMEDLV